MLDWDAHFSMTLGTKTLLTHLTFDSTVKQTEFSFHAMKTDL